jgi:uncharacterized membrane protein YbhN (UPF0104 family)
MKRKLKIFLGPIIIVATIAAFVWYLVDHPKVVDQIRDTSAGTIGILLALYAVAMLALTLISIASLQLLKKPMRLQENFLLTSYTALLNFFGPGQSGPGFRGVYLKVRHGVQLKQYIFVTLIYYAFYAIFSGIILFAYAYPWWQTGGVVVLIAAISYAVIRYFARKNAGIIQAHFRLKPLLLTAAGTLLQITATWLIYYTELHSLNSHVTLGQSLSYTGAANFALFVSLTPGAIGIREAFLVFSQHIHHISSSNIVAANVLDRAVYVAFLGLLFVVVLSMHASKKLQVGKIKQAENT